MGHGIDATALVMSLPIACVAPATDLPAILQTCQMRPVGVPPPQDTPAGLAPSVLFKHHRLSEAHLVTSPNTATCLLAPGTEF